MNANVDNMLNKLSKSKFRNSFHLKEKDINYIKEKGIKKIEEHAKDFIIKRLAAKNIPNDGKQTPFKGHPIFIAQHACACCCRKCLYKWHNIQPNTTLTTNQINYIHELLITWIKKEIS